jgi:hypothetical protein
MNPSCCLTKLIRVALLVEPGQELIWLVWRGSQACAGSSHGRVGGWVARAEGERSSAPLARSTILASPQASRTIT